MKYNPPGQARIAIVARVGIGSSLSRKSILLLAASVLVLTGCASKSSDSEGTRRASPTAALLRGELTTEQYLEAVKDANEEEPTRAYNTRTGRFEYVPEGTIQKWNEETQRWEFTPIE